MASVTHLRRGVKVKVFWLMSEYGKTLNGKVGTIMGYNPKNERWIIRIDGERVQLLAENLIHSGREQSLTMSAIEFSWMQHCQSPHRRETEEVADSALFEVNTLINYEMKLSQKQI